MALLTQYFNENGNIYSVLSVTNFNKADAEYYKDSWQKCYCALLQNKDSGQYVVATLLGNVSWGSGYYADGIKDAIRKYNEIVSDYLMR